MKSLPLLGFTTSRSLGKIVARALVGAAVLGSGCANRYDMKVDAISRSKPAATQTAAAAPVADPVSYHIRSINHQEDEGSLRFKEAAKFVKTALSGKGMYEAANPEQAEMIVDLDYGISAPRATMEVRSEPVYITLPGRTYTERVQVGTDRNGNPIYQVVTMQEPPTTEYAGDREYQVMVIKYEKYLRMTAHENKEAVEGRPPPEVWTIDITTDGESKNLRKYIPIMAAASIDYIGADTRGQKSVTLKEEKDGAVAFVKKGM